MSDTDRLVFATLSTFFLTLLGWIFTLINERATQREQRRVQSELAKLQEQFARDREARQYLIPKRLADLDLIAEWFHQGFRLYGDVATMSRWPKEIPQGGRQDTLLNLFLDNLRIWRNSAVQNVSLARQLDPLPIPNPPWKWGTTPLPDQLPTIMAFYYLEVQDRINEVIDPERPSVYPKVDGQIGDLYRAGLDATERIRQHVVSLGNQKDAK